MAWHPGQTTESRFLCAVGHMVCENTKMPTNNFPQHVPPSFKPSTRILVIEGLGGLKNVLKKKKNTHVLYSCSELGVYSLSSPCVKSSVLHVGKRGKELMIIARELSTPICISFSLYYIVSLLWTRHVICSATINQHCGLMTPIWTNQRRHT